ncbi:proliferation marker protein Ki-67 [Solea solea]|uniref:proliferation marker protein Ki-67 n=1 Tax=Solea solea TaxID=90069 RepID=UPI00272A4ADF|nr:proliferation marker protein Ki-67 [Solea solea]
MPLHGKIVVIKRSGGDGTEFPLTATCLFGRKPDCDIRIQLPQVSKEHCRIDLNENKEVILTNISSVNPTRVNGEVLQQSERLKHGDVITIIDRSFRFEYPPAPTPKKRFSTGCKTKTLKVLQEPQVVDTVTAEPGEKRVSEVFTDGTNHGNIQRSLENTVEVESTGDNSLLQNKTNSPFNDLYQMIKKSLDVKTPMKSSSVSLLQTPTSRFCTPKPGSVKKNDKPVISTEAKNTPMKDDAKVLSGADETKGEVESVDKGTPKSVKKERRSLQLSTENPGPAVEEADHATKSEATSPQRRNRTTPQRFTVQQVVEQVCVQTPPKSPLRRKSKEATPAKPTVTQEPEISAPSTPQTQRVSPRNVAKAEKAKEMPKKRKSAELGADLHTSQMKRKRVSFGGLLSPELFDKRLPPNSPLRKGAAPRRSLCLPKTKLSLLRRASAIGLVKEKKGTPSPKKSPNNKNVTPVKKTPKSRTPSPKAASPGKKTPKSRSPSPKAASPGKKSPKSKSPSPKAASPGKKSPKSKSPSPKAASPGKKSPKSKSPSPKAASPGKKSPKSKSPVSKTPVKRGRSPSTKIETPKTASIVTPGETPTVQGRFSVSHITTPSPVAEGAISDQMPSVPVTPKIPLNRKSMKSNAKKTPSVAKSAVKVMRRSGISRASMKFKNSWANIVKFGQVKAQVAAPAKKTVVKITTKKAVPKMQTPARKLHGHVSTGHANSPVTIVVGKAHKQSLLQPTGAAPKVVVNAALSKKNMKMDEDLTGISEMFKTPVNEKKRKSVLDCSAPKTPLGVVGTSVVEPSVLNTPEEPGEMIVSPLSVASTVKSREYNSEAVQRLLNGDEESSFALEISDSETQPESSEQQSAELKPTTVMTPKQKPEQLPCLTGVKRIMKTPRQKAEPVEDLRGKLLATPKQQKPTEIQECFSGVKRIFSTPQQEPEAVEDLQGKLPENTPKALEAGDVSLIVSETENKMNQDVESHPMVCLTDVERVIEEPQDDIPEATDDTSHVSVVEEADEALLSGDEGPSSHAMKTVSPTATDDVSEEPPKVDAAVENLFNNQPEMEITTGEVTEMEAPVESEVAENKQEVAEQPADLVAPAPVRRERGKKTEATAPPAVRKTRNGKNADVTEEESAPQPSKVAVQPKRGRNAKKVSDDPAEMVPEAAPETPKSKQISTVDVNLTVNDGAAPEEIAVSKPKRGRKTKQPEATRSVPEKQDDPCAHSDGVSQAAIDEVAPEVCTDVLEVMPPTTDETKSSADVQETVPQAPETESLPQVDTEANAAVVQKKSLRGRKAKLPESKPEETDLSEEPVVAAPVRGRKGKKTEATAPPAVRQTRTRNAKSQESTCDDKPEIAPEVCVEPQPMAETSPEEALVNNNQKESESTVEEAAVKPKRGRKAKQTPVETSQPEMEKTEVVADEQIIADPPQPIPIAVKPTRGRKAKPDAVKQNGVAEVTAVTEETKQVSQLPARAKRGRKAKLEEEEKEIETSDVQEPVKKLRKNIKVEQDNIKSMGEEIVEMAIPLKAEASSVPEPQEMSEQVIVTAKPKRERKSKQCTESEATEDQEVPAVKSTEKPKRGRRGKETAEVDVATVDAPEAESDNLPEAQEKNAEPDAPVIKTTRGRGVKTSVKSEDSQVVPAKRTRRGAAPPLEDVNPEPTVQDSSVPASVEPVKRGRRVASAKPAAKETQVSSDQASLSEDLNGKAEEEDAKMTKRSVRWKPQLEVFPVPKVTPVKSARGRKSKLVEAESKIDADKAQDKNLSDEVVEAQPIKRARRGAKVADELESSSTVEPQKGAEAETPLKTRRGRSAKK